MASIGDIVITGLGVVCPIGVGAEALWRSLLIGRSGISHLGWQGAMDLLDPIGGAVTQFEPARYVRPRKNLKVMGREIQFGVAAADMACAGAKVASGGADPERVGVVFGADMMVSDLDELVRAYRASMVDGEFAAESWGNRSLPEMFPLWMLKYLPNMPACHIGIALDARGPNNSHALGEVSSLTAVGEAAQVIERGQTDVMIAGGTGSRIHPLTMARYCARQMSHRTSDPAGACRPFDAGRDGMVLGEGAAAFVLEREEQAAARGATVYARILAFASAFEPSDGPQPRRGDAIRRVIHQALVAANVKPAEVGHVNAHGLSTTEDDRLEAQAIRDLLGDVPVTAPKSYFGNLGAASGAVEMAVSVLALQHKMVPATLNYERPDPSCPIRVIRGEPMPCDKPVALVLNYSDTGQAAAVVLSAGEGTTLRG